MRIADLLTIDDSVARQKPKYARNATSSSASESSYGNALAHATASTRTGCTANVIEATTAAIRRYRGSSAANDVRRHVTTYTNATFSKCTMRLDAWNADASRPKRDLIADHMSHASG